MRVVFALLAAATLAACQTPCPSAPAEETQARFRCEDGSTLAVTFARRPDVARIAQDGFPLIELPSRGTGSGYRYASEGAELRGRGSEVRWSRPGSDETLCQEIH